MNINKLDDVKRIITKFLLIENSIVALPANPDALNVEVSKKSLEIKEVSDSLKENAPEVKEAQLKNAQLEQKLEVKEEVKSLPKILIIDRVGGLDIKKMYEDYKNGKII